MSLLGTNQPDNLIAGDYPIVSKGDGTIGTDADLTRGAILGEIKIGAVPTTGTADAGNTGDGTVTAVVGGSKTQVGDYKIINVEAVTNGGIFQILDPSGNLIGEVTIPAGAGATVDFATNEISGTITDGATDFALGDFFLVTVPAGSGKFIHVKDAAIDGSQNPVAILLEDAAAAAADVENAPMALSGEFNDEVVSVGDGAVSTRKDALRSLNIYLKSPVKK